MAPVSTFPTCGGSSNDDGTDDTGAQRDDDRPLAVNDITVNEVSPYAVFEVSGAANQLATLSLVGGFVLMMVLDVVLG